MNYGSIVRICGTILVLCGAAAYSDNFLNSTSNDWRFNPADAWSFERHDDSFVITVQTDDNKASYTAVLDLSGRIDLDVNREFVLSGWINTKSDAYSRDDFAVIAIVGTNGFRADLREFQSNGQWVYFEKALAVPEMVSGLRVILYGKVSPAVIAFKSLSLCEVDKAAAFRACQAKESPSASKWLLPDCQYRIKGSVSDSEGNQPLWVDLDFSRLLILSADRNPIDPASIKVLAVDSKGITKNLAVSFDKPLSNLSDHYKRNGTLKWRTVGGFNNYEIYFNTAKTGAEALILNEQLGIGELINYAPDAIVPAWAGWPGGWLDIRDIDGDGDYDIYANNTDAGVWLLRNIGTNEKPLFLPRQKPVAGDKLADIKLPDERLDWNNDGKADTVVWQRQSRGDYVAGVWACLRIEFNDGSNSLLTDAGGREIIFDNATWSQVCCGDFDGDGFTDLAVGTADSDLQILINISSDAMKTAVDRVPYRFNTYLENPFDSGDMSLKPAVIDWNKDGRDDIVFTAWNGFIYLMLNKNLPAKAEFEQPVQLRQLSGNLSLADSPTPDVVDWDGDGLPDIVCADVNGHITFFRNKGSLEKASFEYGGWLENDRGEPIRITAGQHGSTIQGAVEKWWGYLSCQAADVDNDGDIDLIINDSLGRLRWIENTGSRNVPVLSSLIRPFLYKSITLITPWRNRPGAADWDGDGITELTVVNQDGNLVLYKIDPRHPDYLYDYKVLNDQQGNPVSLFPPKTPDRSKGRSQIDTADWDGDGDIDIMIGRPRGAVGGGNILYFENIGTKDEPVIKPGILQARGLRFVEWTGSDGHDQWHSGGPCMADWDGDGKTDLIFGCESGRLSYYKHDFFNGDMFPVFNPAVFEKYSDGKCLAVFDFQKDANENTEALVPSDTPIQWLDDEKKSAAEISKRKVEIVSPAPGAAISGEILFEAVVTGTGVGSVDFYVDRIWIAKESVAPYTAFGDDEKWNTALHSNGRHSLSVIVTYLDGKTVETSCDVIINNPK